MTRCYLNKTMPLSILQRPQKSSFRTISQNYNRGPNPELRIQLRIKNKLNRKYFSTAEKLIKTIDIECNNIDSSFSEESSIWQFSSVHLKKSKWKLVFNRRECGTRPNLKCQSHMYEVKKILSISPFKNASESKASSQPALERELLTGETYQTGKPFYIILLQIYFSFLLPLHQLQAVALMAYYFAIQKFSPYYISQESMYTCF